MNRKQLTLILVACVVIGGLSLWFRNLQNRDYRGTAGRMGDKVLATFDVNAVAGIHLVGPTNELTLNRQDGRWVVREREGYPANFSTVGDLVRNLWELKATQPVQAGESQLGRLELNAPDSPDGPGLLVELRNDKSEDLAKLLLGKKQMRKPATPSPMGGDEGWPVGRYVMVPGDLKTLTLVSETFSNIEPKADQWLNKDFFKVEKTRTVKVTWPEATNSWELTRETATGALQLVDAGPEETLDTSKAGSISSALGYPSFKDVTKEADPATTGLDNAVTVRLDTFDDFHYTINVGRPAEGDDYYITLAVTADLSATRVAGEDEKDEDKEKLDKEFQEKLEKLKEKLAKEEALAGWTFEVAKWSFDTVLKKRGELLSAETSTETDTETASDAGFPLDLSEPTMPIVPSLEPIPPPPSPTDATDVIPATRIEPIEAPPIPQGASDTSAPPSTESVPAAADETAKPPDGGSSEPEAQPSASASEEPPASTQATEKPAGEGN